MQITIEIPEQVAAQAKAQGLTPEDFVKTLLKEHISTLSGLSGSRRKISIQEFFEGMAADSDRLPLLPEEAFTRESFYQDHD